MPHLLIDRLRQVPDFICPCIGGEDKNVLKRRAYVIDVLDIIGGILFVWGSFDFLPEYSWDPVVLMHGCALFIAGALIHLGICLYCLTEAVQSVGLRSFECCQNLLYVSGCVFFLYGTILYWPAELSLAHPEDSETLIRGAHLMGVGLPVYIHTMSRPFRGTVLFIVGSFLYALAAFVNGLKLHEFHDLRTQLLTATTSVYMIGSLLFVAGSVAFLPDLGCNQNMERLGGWCFIWGSAKFAVGGTISLYRTHIEVFDGEKAPLKDMHA